MRESASKLPVYAPAGVTALLDGAWPLYRVLSAYSGVEPRVLDEARPMPLTDHAGAALGLCCSAAPVARRAPRYAPGVSQATFDVGLRLEDERTGGTLAYVPTAGAIDDRGRRVYWWEKTRWSSSCERAAALASSGRRVGAPAA